MKILYDHQIFTMQEYGGISRYFFELADNIAKAQEAEIRIVSPLYVNSYLESASPRLQITGTKVPVIRRTGRIYRALNRALASPLAGHYHPDLVHETYYSSLAMAPKGCKVVLTVFDMIHERFGDYFPPHDSTSKDKAAAVKRADHVICISEHTRQDLMSILGVPPVKTSVIHLGFSLSKTVPQFGRGDTRPFLLYVGARGGYKNFEGLLRAYAESIKLKNDFDLICFGGEAFTNKEISLFQQLGLAINAVRQVSGSDAVLAGYYQAASTFVYPSLYEGFGIPPLEAMSFNCPVVCSNVSSIPEVVGNAGLMFDPNDTQSIGLAIEQVVGNSALRKVLIARGQERIKQFSWERCAQETLDVYRKVLA
jgi:glycosyltransferase involved in cell wall biosynthesis